MRIRGFKHKHKETLYKDDGRNKETTETSRDSPRYTEYKIDEKSVLLQSVCPRKETWFKASYDQEWFKLWFGKPWMGTQI